MNAGLIQCQLMVVAVLVNRGCAGVVGKVVPLIETPPQSKAVPVCSRLESIRCNEKWIAPYARLTT